MLNEIILAVIQAVTEFLPISSSGHLALFSTLLASHKGDVFFFSVLHLASLLAVLIFTRQEITELLSFDEKYRKMWIYLIIATIPAVIFGLVFNKFIEQAFTSLLFVGGGFLFTGIILFLTKFSRERTEINWKNSLVTGLFQVFALFPGVSRSGITISSSLFQGIEREKAAKFSFLLFIPLAIGAFVLEFGTFAFSFTLLISFLITLVLSLIFLNLLLMIVKSGRLWVFSIYCFIIGVISLSLYFV